jgi:hypothetical protein
LLNDVIDLKVGYLGERNVVEIDYKHILLSMIGHHLIILCHEHQIIDSVEDLIKRHLEIQLVDPHHQQRQHLFIIPIRIDRSFFQLLYGFVIQLGDYFITVIGYDVSDALDGLLVAPLCCVDVF